MAWHGISMLLGYVPVPGEGTSEQGNPLPHSVSMILDDRACATFNSGLSSFPWVSTQTTGRGKEHEEVQMEGFYGHIHVHSQARTQTRDLKELQGS